MLFKIAWRNIWRNKLRSLVLALSVVVGLWAGMFIMAFSWGMNREHVDDVVQTQLSHIQIHHPKFAEDKLIEYVIKDGEEIEKQLQSDKRVKGVSGRNLTSGMVSSASYASGVTIYGVRPSEEKKVSNISTTILEGQYFSDGKRNEVMIGEKLAEKLGVKLKNKIVLTFQSVTGDITSGSFRIVGIFRTKNSMFDEATVYTRFSDLSTLLGTGNGLHEIAVLLKEDKQFEIVATELGRIYPQVKVETWKDLAPELELIIDSFTQYMYVFIAIILLALMFGIINTMLMAVLERQREFGMLMAIGLNKRNVFGMIVLETVMLTSIGIPLGLLSTYFSVAYFHNYGIDVSSFSEGLAKFGYNTIIYPQLENTFYLPIALMTTGSALISAIYPAMRALKFKPAEAIRKI